MCLLIVNYMPDILEHAINVNKCFEKWQRVTVVHQNLCSPSSWADDCPAILQFPAFLAVSCGQMIKFLPTEYEQRISVALLGLNIKNLGMTPSCSFPSPQDEIWTWQQPR